jgi:hypothetical protein
MKKVFNILGQKHPLVSESLSGVNAPGAKKSAPQPQPGPPPCINCGICCNESQVSKTTCSTLTLECIDFRLRDNMACQLNLLGLRNDYDAACLPGTSLAYNGNLPGYTGFNTYFDNNVQIAYSLHNIQNLYLVEHENCGAYKVAYGTLTPEQELNYQIQNGNQAVITLLEKFNPTNGTILKIPNLKIIGYRISVDGCTMTQIY